MIITSSISVESGITETLSFGTASLPVQSNLNTSYSFGSGTTTGCTDLHWEKKAVQLAAGNSVTYTLSALTDDLSRAVAMAKVRELLLVVTTRTSGDTLLVGEASTNPWLAIVDGTTPGIKVADLLHLVSSADGYAVGAGTSDQLKITNSGSHTIVFTLRLNGTSA